MSRSQQPLHDPQRSTTEDLRYALLHLMQVTDLVAGFSIEGLFAPLDQREARV